jgi:hypothetical protein
MIQINIKKQNVIANSATFETQDEADAWLQREEANFSFGKPEHTVEVSPGTVIFHEATEDTEAYEEVSEAVFEVVATEYVVEIVDVSAEVSQQAINQAALKYLSETDWMVLRHLRQKALNLPTTLSDADFLLLEQERQNKANSII